MKKHLGLSLLIIVASILVYQPQLKAQANHMFATTPSGGINGLGTILAGDDSGGNFHVVYNFDWAGGFNALGRMVQGFDGKLYGCTQYGGFDDSCCLYGFDPATNLYSVLYQFAYTPQLGYVPLGGLTLATDGTLYGFTYDGGANNDGAIFNFSATDTVYQDVFDFVDSLGSSPHCELLLANGNLYGVTQYGGAYGNGVIFSYSISGGIYTVLHSFDSLIHQGTYPGNLILASDGKLYGTQFQGYDTSYGNMFSYDLSSSTYTVLYTFSSSTGFPSNGLVQAGDGKLYGCTSSMDETSGKIYSYDITNGTFSTVADLTDSTGYYTTRTLTKASDGKLYGAAASGGYSNIGTFFKFDVNNQSITKLLDLDGTSGSDPDCQIFEIPPTCSLVTNPIHAAICSGASYQVGGHLYATTGIYNDTLQSSLACDSIIQLTLTVNQLPDVSLSLPVAPICAGQPFTLSGGSPSGGTYSGTGVSGGIFSLPLAGIDTITYTYTDNNQCSNASQAIIVTQICDGLIPLSANEITLRLFPQPATGNLSVLCGLINQSKFLLNIYDITGRGIAAPWHIESGKVNVDIGALSAGAYSLSLQTEEGKASGIFLVK